jgi:hypothetical protein
MSKQIYDPIHGFVTITPLMQDFIDTYEFQRLRDLKQLGATYYVFPSATHTRFEHSIGVSHLAGLTMESLKNAQPELEITKKDIELCRIAGLLHDIGHGAFSHALEHSIVDGISHEEISLKFMKKLNAEFNGQLTIAINVFEGKYPRKFLNQLISSQLDIDRLDYLKRDSFYTGVAEGNISSERLIAMIHVVNDELVIEQKGIYSVEKFLIARRLMYWQVYLHKTGLSAENMLVNVLRRAKELSQKGERLFASKALTYFLTTKITEENFTDETLEIFSKLDDYDILSAIKEWTDSSDRVLSLLSKMIVDRNLLKVEIQQKRFSETDIDDKISELKSTMHLSETEARYFVFQKQIQNQAYNPSMPIKILNKNGELKDIAKASDQLNLQALTKPVIKHFVCYPKQMKLAQS